MDVRSQLIKAQLEQRATSPTKKSEIVYNTVSNEVEYFDNVDAKVVVSESGTQTLTNKTLTSPVINTKIDLANNATLDLYEATGNGTSKISLSAPASLAGDLALALPGAAPTTGDFLQAASSTTTQWVTQSALSLPTGTMFPYFGSSAPSGYVVASGRTIGSGASGSTERANADTEALYTVLWDSIANAELGILDSAGVASTRGASAAADFAANKRMPLPDLRGRTVVGKDDMGGSAASRMTSAGSGVDGATLGKSGGAQTHALSANENGTHTHIQDAHTHTQDAHTHGYVRPTQATITSGGFANGAHHPDASATSDSTTATNQNTTATNQNSGLGTAHNNTQPSFIVNMIIKL